MLVILIYKMKGNNLYFFKKLFTEKGKENSEMLVHCPNAAIAGARPVEARYLDPGFMCAWRKPRYLSHPLCFPGITTRKSGLESEVELETRHSENRTQASQVVV